MKKILFVNSLYTPDIAGGAEIILQKQVEGLHRLGHDVVVLASTEHGELSLDYVNGIKVYRARLRNLFWPYRRNSASILKKMLWHLKDRHNKSMAKFIAHVIVKEKPDVVMVHNLSGWSISAWKAIKKFNIPIVQVLHDYYLLTPTVVMYNSNKSKDSRKLSEKIFRYGFSKKSTQIDYVIGVSQFILDTFTNHGYFKDVPNSVVYNCLNICADENIECRKKGNVRLTIGFIGTLSEIKGVELLIQTFKKLPINARLLIAGKGSSHYESYLKKIAKDDSRIYFLGYVESRAFYSDIDLLIVPSLWQEPFGLVAVESCAHGIPVIASNCGGLTEIIRNNVNGTIIDISENSLLSAISFYANNDDKLNLQKKKSRESVLNFLDQNVMIQAYSDIVEKL
ncbi:glycosyltransferase involved in cell wall biosynthesis [Orbus hercynius]|uniref:Glycosyltransferase involved in cell wall biosynthesis n=1 Tax=Orbus hercynius TaxID=593135 RepID=A0A495RB31_9GAMM|nr:glycosyltransferase family 4 protein [Orbus hercynius]RKS84692.1 glycosyltransferase involved in cell wall biosynthesis [Orbus hercynius]